MSFESPDVEKEFPGLYASQGLEHELSEEEERSSKKRDSKSREKKRDRKDKGYRMFEEEDSEEELVVDDTRSPSKMKKHGKPSFKFYKPKDKDKDGQKEKEKEEKKKEESKKDKPHKPKKMKPGSSSKADVKDNTAIGPKAEVKPIFGVPLSLATERSRCHDGVQVPAIFRECIDYIEEFGLSCEGIYRISGVKSKVQQLKEAYNYGVPVYLHEHEPSIVASLLKQYLRELPEPVLTAELMPKFDQASTLKNVKQKVEQFQQLIEQLPTPNRLLLSWTIIHMTHVIAKESQNKMSLQNVSIVLSPTMQISHRVLNVFFTYSKILFEDVVIKRYVPPLRAVSSRWSLELPDSPTAIGEELHKQESLLSQLHEDVRKVKDSTEMEEQLWEVQRVVTQLKRKLKSVRKAQEAAKAAEKRDAELRQEKLKQQQQQQAQSQQVEIKDSDQASPHPQSPSQTEPPALQPPPGIHTQVQVQPQVQVQVQVPTQEGKPQQKVAVQPESEVAQVDEPQSAQVQTVAVIPPPQPQPQDLAQPQPQPLPQPQPQTLTHQTQPIPKPPSPGPAASVAPLGPPSAPESDPVPQIAAPRQVAPKQHLMPQQGTVPKLQSPLQPQKLHDNQQQPTVPLVPEELPSVPPAGDLMEVKRKIEGGVMFEMGGEELYIGAEGEDSVAHLSSEEAVVAERLNDLSLADRTEKRHITTIEIVDRMGLPTIETTASSMNEEDETSDTSSAASSYSLVSSPEEEEDEELKALLLEETKLKLEDEELSAIGDELRQKIETERCEIERLRQEIAEIQEIRDDLGDDDDSSSVSSDSSEDEEELREVLKSLIMENKELEVENAELSMKVHQERQYCLDAKVQIRLIQLRQVETERS